ncbi:hypothetical protein SAMN06272781_0293 [Streptomyces sp. 1222.2]|nr:hypothetical protein SAMN06272781_0293 [Streptomyces sp. 1222.2]
MIGPRQRERSRLTCAFFRDVTTGAGESQPSLALRPWLGAQLTPDGSLVLTTAPTMV